MWDIAESMAKKKSKNFSKLSKDKQFNLIDKNRLKATLSLLSSQEQEARERGATHMLGISHFDPEMAARLGYKDSDILNPKIQKALLQSPKSSFNYYKTQNEASIKNNFSGPMAAYWQTAPVENLRIFEKDLRISPEEAILQGSKSPSLKNLAAIKEREKTFTKEFSSKLKNWYINQ